MVNWAGVVVAVRLSAVITPPATFPAAVPLFGWRYVDSLHSRVDGYEKACPGIASISLALPQTSSSGQDISIVQGVSGNRVVITQRAHRYLARKSVSAGMPVNAGSSLQMIVCVMWAISPETSSRVSR